jgi:hypothetical protein
VDCLFVPDRQPAFFRLAGTAGGRLPALIALTLTFLIWGLVAHMSGMRPLVVPLSPVIVFGSVLLAFHSMRHTLTHRAEWKDRYIS